jgi:hypothetical protein
VFLPPRAPVLTDELPALLPARLFALRTILTSPPLLFICLKIKNQSCCQDKKFCTVQKKDAGTFRFVTGYVPPNTAG